MTGGDGIVTIESRLTVTETIDRLVEVVTKLGLNVFARIDHAAGARDVGMALRPTELLIFGNPKGGTPLMQDRQIAGIDLPVKALAWEDEAGKVWLSYNTAEWIAVRHHLGDASNAAVQAIAGGMSKVVGLATGREE
ncbi:MULTISPECIES: DUF302 domain-containing protein [Phyllobacteriaceae]|jgi:uncharacterized protein (DUF302 family)|uniref:DUF302 domain-containing protein n=2 Tax=Pseudomonadota TaxID=1224 RepID=A0A1C2DHR8_9HYPH|nr:MULTISPECIES: DUF302 domain-containing protein [Mesorhizobium]MBN9235378.1 DUF302 domain-containing protein [Mesorhizobium sp.]MDQ0332700.1 uncharacterized protein (DUF302 family) [Mesorhizobium sp. YL-MeA3-2017]OCX14319.1 hypothetical protein QV13_17640 [Mesorhizobium hungaricum]